MYSKEDIFKSNNVDNKVFQHFFNVVKVLFMILSRILCLLLQKVVGKQKNNFQSILFMEKR
jgi:hypothetical protein